MSTIGAIIVAAGLSSRMGRFKPLLPFRGSTIIGTIINGMLQANISEIVIVLGYKGNEIDTYLKENYLNYLYNNCNSQRIITVRNENYVNSDMLESVKIGMRALVKSSCFFVNPVDIPAINVSTYKQLIAKKIESEKYIVYPSVNAHIHHPPIIDEKCISYINSFNDKGGLKKALEYFSNKSLLLEVDDIGYTLDVDTQSDYENLLKYDKETTSQKHGN